MTDLRNGGPRNGGPYNPINCADTGLIELGLGLFLVVGLERVSVRVLGSGGSGLKFK